VPGPDRRVSGCTPTTSRSLRAPARRCRRTGRRPRAAGAPAAAVRTRAAGSWPLSSRLWQQVRRTVAQGCQPAARALKARQHVNPRGRGRRVPEHVTDGQRIMRQLGDPGSEQVPSFRTRRVQSQSCRDWTGAAQGTGPPSSVKGCCAIATRRPAAALDPGDLCGPCRTVLRAGRGLPSRRPAPLQPRHDKKAERQCLMLCDVVGVPTSRRGFVAYGDRLGWYDCRS
jgi:hypothetical protein